MKQINEVQRMQQLAGINEIKVKNPGQSFSLVMDPEFPTELELVSNENNEIYTGYIRDRDRVYFSTNMRDEDVEFMSMEEIFSEYAPGVFKEMRDEGASWSADDEDINIVISLNKLKELFPQ
jgi:hypothetical protein